MGIHERKKREKHEKRSMILKAAMQLFIEEGYENVSIRKIADRIEYSPATIYLYFADKDEIYLNLQQEGFRKFLDALSLSESEPDPAERIRSLGRQYIRFGIGHPEYYDLMFITNSPMRKIEKLTDWKEGEESYLVLLRSVQYAMEHGKFKGTDPIVIATGLWSIVHGLVAFVNRKRMNLGEDSRQIDRAIAIFNSFILELF